MKDTFISYLNSHNILVADSNNSMCASEQGYEGIFSVIDYALREYGVFFDKGVELINASVLLQLDDLFDDIQTESEQKIESKVEQEKKEPVVTNTVQQASKTPKDTYDLQKELEAKFDELFGTFDDNNDSNK